MQVLWNRIIILFIYPSPSNAFEVRTWGDIIHCCPGAHFTIYFSIVIQIRRKIGFSVSPLYGITSQLTVPHSTTVQVSCQCAKFHSDHLTSILMRVEWNCGRIWITMEKSFVKRAPGPYFRHDPITAYIIMQSDQLLPTNSWPIRFQIPPCLFRSRSQQSGLSCRSLVDHKFYPISWLFYQQWINNYNGQNIINSL